MTNSAAPTGYEALPRPETWFNRLIRRVSDPRVHRVLTLEDVRPFFLDSLRAFRRLGATETALSAVEHSFERRWQVVGTSPPRNVWSGEVVFKEGREPLVIMYLDSPWSRTPERLFRMATVASVDHFVAHLLEYYSGADYGEEAACRDQVRLMLSRRGWQYRAAALTIVAVHRVHKHIPLRTYGPALCERYVAHWMPASA